MINKIQDLVQAATNILIIQADNPDADSLGSALALEALLGDMGKNTYMYCGVDMPAYLHHLTGWDRVTTNFPNSFDLSIIVDASTLTLLEKAAAAGKLAIIQSKPCIVLDHHETVENHIPFATVIFNDTQVSSTGELIYKVATQLNWDIKTDSGANIMSAILGDTQGLTNSLASSNTYNIMASLINLGVDRSVLEEKRRQYVKMPPEIFVYKATLIQRTEFHIDGKLAIVDVPHDEIMKFSPLYNPAPLVQNDMLMTTGVGISMVLKHYNDGKILYAIRCNNGYAVVAKLAEHIGGGGHKYASGFKITDGRTLNDIKQECVRFASILIDEIEQENPNEATQYAYTSD